jgi:AcrR family transcriptional regulator
MIDEPPSAAEPPESGDRRPPQQARAIRTRRRLLATGLEAFSRFGHDGVNLHQDILGPAGVSVGSFYHQFSDKTELLLEIINTTGMTRRNAVISIGLDDEQHASFDAAVRGGFRAYFDSLDDPAHGWALQFNELSSSSEAVRELLRRGRREWLAGLAAVVARWHPGADPEVCLLAAQGIRGVATGLGMAYLDLPGDVRPDRRESMCTVGAEFAIAGTEALLSR